MNRTSNERYIMMLLSGASLGLIGESYLMGWEFWVPPILFVATVYLWFVYLSGVIDYRIRKLSYLIFALFAVLFHGVHETSFFDVALVTILALVGFSLLESSYMMNLFLCEFLVLLSLQIGLAVKNSEFVFDKLTVSRIALHIAIVVLVYIACMKSVRERMETRQAKADREKLAERADSDMEDFLTNISHELRTPVNVVNGISEIMIKRNENKEALSIKEAGIRLAYQIEDIQDFTECRRKKVILEDEEYMSTSLINDVVMSFRLIDNEKDLELIVDLDPAVPIGMRGDVKKLHKIFRHLLENAVKFTRQGGIYVKMYAENTDYGVNLCIEMTDTGIGMDRKALSAVSEGMFQVNKKRTRSTGGIGLGLYIVYGFAHRMGGFVKIESERHVGTTVRVTIPQKVTDPKRCIALSHDIYGDILFHVRSDKYKVPRVRDFYRSMATNLATGMRLPLYPTQTVNEIERLKERKNISFIFMGEEEYTDNPEYFDEMSKGDIVVVVSASDGFKPNPGSNVLVMPKPLYAYPVIRVLNEGHNVRDMAVADESERPSFKGIKALVVDDEPMNLVVAAGIFRDYEMIVDTAGSGKEGISKYREGDYDVVFMDHMMPEMDGVETMKHIKSIAMERHNPTIMIMLTANAVSGAREMFMKEGFDGFLAKPLSIPDFERVMLKALPKLAARVEQG